MKSSEVVNFSRNNKNKINNLSNKYELPFIKFSIASRRDEKNHILRKVLKSKSAIHYQIDKLLQTGFNGTLDDFYKVYGRQKSIKKRKNKMKAHLSSIFLLRSNAFSGPIKLTKTKEFHLTSKNKEKPSFNMAGFISEYSKKKLNYNFHLDKSKSKMNNNSSLDIKSKIFKCYNNSDSNNCNLSNLYYNKENIIKKHKNELEKMQNIRKIRKILNIKNRNIFMDEINNIPKKSFIKENNMNILILYKNRNDFSKFLIFKF